MSEQPLLLRNLYVLLPTFYFLISPSAAGSHHQFSFLDRRFLHRPPPLRRRADNPGQPRHSASTQQRSFNRVESFPMENDSLMFFNDFQRNATDLRCPILLVLCALLESASRNHLPATQLRSSMRGARPTVALLARLMHRRWAQFNRINRSMKTLTRRHTILRLLAAALMLSLVAGCDQKIERQQSQGSAEQSPPANQSSIPVVGVANYGAHPILDVITDSFKARIKERGFEEGKNIHFLWKSIEGDVNLAPSVGSSLLNSNVNVIVSITTPVSQAVSKTARGKIPIVFCGVTDPISAGLVESWENKHGSGITGTSDRWPYAEQLDLIKTLVPAAKKVGFPYNSGEANSQYALTQVTPLAEQRGLTIVPIVAMNSSEVRRAAEALAEQGVDVIYVSSDNTVMAGFEAVLKVSHERRLPVIVGESANVERGGLATFSVDYKQLGYATADLVIRVLKGEAPGSIPVVTFKGEQLYLNADAAQKMGIKLPPELISKAAKVYGQP